MIKEFSYIQQEILSCLITSKTLRYGEINRLRFENDLFNYHLQFLVKHGLVKKSKEGFYSLTALGSKQITHQYPVTIDKSHKNLHRLGVLVIVINNGEQGTWLLGHRSKVAPFYKDDSITGGYLESDETILAAARRNIFNMTGLTILNPRLIGCIRQMDNINQDRLLFIVCTDKFTGSLIAENRYGLNYWIGIPEMLAKEEISDAPSQILIHCFDNLLKGKKLRRFSFAEEYQYMRLE